MDPLTIGLILMAAGAGTQMYAQKKAANRADSVRVERLAKLKKTAEQARDSVLENLREYDPTTRSEKQAELAGQAEQGYVAATVDAAEDQAAADPGVAGKVSEDFLTGKANAIRSSADRASTHAALLSKFRAPTDLRKAEALKNAEFASREEILASLLRSRKATGDQLVEMAGKPNERLLMLGSLMQAAGGAVAGGAGVAGAGAGGASITPGAVGSSAWVSGTAAPVAAQSAGSLGPGVWSMLGRGSRAIAPVM